MLTFTCLLSGPIIFCNLNSSATSDSFQTQLGVTVSTKAISALISSERVLGSNDSSAEARQFPQPKPTSNNDGGLSLLADQKILLKKEAVKPEFAESSLAESQILLPLQTDTAISEEFGFSNEEAFKKSDTDSEHEKLLEPADSETTEENPYSNKDSSLLGAQTNVSKSSEEKVSHEIIVPERAKIWFHAHKFWEGLAAQRITIEELLLKSKELNAWFVEPCIQGGRLLSCGLLNQNEKYVKLGDVYDLDKLKEYYPKIASFETFAEIQAYDEYCVYYNVQRRKKIRYLCKVNYGKLALSHDQLTVSRIAQMSGQGVQNVVLSLPQAERYMFDMKGNGNKDFKSKYYVFNPKQYEYVQEQILPALSLSKGEYSVIHWRAERIRTSHVTCAKAIIHAKEQMEKTLPKNHTFVLMTALRRKSMDKLLWSDYRKRTEEKKPENDTELALQLLEESGFVSLEAVIDPDKILDSSLLATWDLIVAENAKEFSTCTRQGLHQRCETRTRCNLCNHLGNFSNWAIDLRRYQGKSSEECWRP